MTEYSFPEGFLWGSATSAFQVEGECDNHDFYDWAVKGKIKDGSNPYDAVLHYRKYREDIDLLKELNHNTARIGLEWARIEPREGYFDNDVLEHYKDELLLMKNRGISTMVTLHHFSTPLWLVEKGGWENPKSIEYFSRYVKNAVESLGGLIDFYLTINEPTVLAFEGYFVGFFPPGKRSLLKTIKVNNILADAHISAYNIIHSIHAAKGLGQPKVGVAKHMRNFDPENPHSFLDKLMAAFINSFFNYSFLKRVMSKGPSGTLDIFGINYYSGCLVKFPLGLSGRKYLKKNILGWDIYPDGFYKILKEVWEKFGIPIYVTENGTCDNDDELREEFIKEHVKAMHKAISEGVDIRGYYYWSTLDNFELVEGISKRFGLVHVDHNSPDRIRTIKKSGKFYAEIIRNNGLIE